MLGILIILFDTFANFCRSYPDNRVRISVVVGGSLEDFDTENALFELVGLTGQYARNGKPQETGISLAGME